MFVQFATSVSRMLCYPVNPTVARIRPWLAVFAILAVLATLGVVAAMAAQTHLGAPLASGQAWANT